MRLWRRDPRGFRVYLDSPSLDLFRLPPQIALTIPADGGFWLINRLTGIRYRRVTMADLPKDVTWNTRRPGKKEEADADV